MKVPSLELLVEIELDWNPRLGCHEPMLQELFQFLQGQGEVFSNLAKLAIRKFSAVVICKGSRLVTHLEHDVRPFLAKLGEALLQGQPNLLGLRHYLVHGLGSAQGATGSPGTA